MKFKLKHKRRCAFYGLITVSLIGLILFIRKNPISSFDYYITNEIQELKRGRYTSLMTFVSLFGNSVMVPFSVIFASLFFYWTNYRREARFVLAALVFDTLNIVVKLLINRSRPTVKDALIMQHFNLPAFPSGHVVHYVVFFGFLLTVMLVQKKIPYLWRVFIIAWSALLILTVSVSRIYLGAHWATDVLGAYLFGIFYLGILLTFYLKLPEVAPKLIKKIIPIAALAFITMFGSTLAFAAAPFRTDDAEPVEYHQAEFLVFSEATHVRDDIAGVFPGFEFNYGLLPEMELGIAAPFAFDKATGTDAQFGYGDTKISIMYRLMKENENGWRPEASIAPEVNLPTGDSDKDLGEGHTREFLPLWLEKNWGPWTTYGGGGYWINPGDEKKNYWFFGWVVMRKITEQLSVGGEIFHQTADTLDGVDSTGFNLGFTYDVTKNQQLMFSAGRGIQNAAATNAFSYYIGYQLTF